MSDYDVRLGMPLTKRESEIVRAYVLDHTKKEIAVVLGITYSTVHAHTRHIYTKVGCTSQLQLLAWALRKGLVTVDEIKGITCR